MNANELADYMDENIDAYYASEQKYLDKAATMLRQQQAEIEALKAKTLTDEEIIDIALKEVDGWVTKEHLKNFARAILRKAQEK
jgi:uncharacterized membrane protein YkoI